MRWPFFIFTRMDDALKILQKYWGYESFRPVQEQVIGSVLEKTDTLALMPTGGGKSVCYQIPGLMRPGITIVVSPLIALMNDQVENLKKRNIRALALTSAMSYRQIDIGLNNCVTGHYKFLYVSPERLKTELFTERIKAMNVNLLAIDEAHCISQWGYDFRPSYLEIARIREIIPQTPVLALTASATNEVAADITEKLHFKKPQIIRGSFERPELSYVVIEDDNKRERLHKILRKVNRSGIVYAGTRKEVRELSQWLNKNGHNTAYYHAGLSMEQREKVRNAWMNEEVKTVIATNAFGMGIDKPDVRLVVHLSLPSSLEAYYQEAGRAGRDGKRSWAVTLFNRTDIDFLLSNITRMFPPVETVKFVYRALANYFRIPYESGRGRSFPLDIEKFAKRYNLKTTEVFYSLKFLEKEGYLSLSDFSHSPSQVHIPVNRNTLYRFQLENPKLEPVIKILLRSYSGLFDDFETINESLIARRLKCSRYELVKKLKYLAKFDLIEYREQSDLPWITWLEDRMRDNNILISSENYHTLRENTEKRVQALVSYVTNREDCRNKIILNYFGMSSDKECGICDVCIARRKARTNSPEGKEMRNKILRLIDEQVSGRELPDHFPADQRQQVIEIIRVMKDEELIKDD